MKKDYETLGNYGGLLSLIEVGLGSLLHSLHIPFAGVFLSLNQGYLLCRATIKTQDRSIGLSISNIAAVLKSLSPAGNKLGPMLSLSMQGLLFSIGTIVLGLNPVGLSFGMALLSVWSFLQPIVTYYLFFGDELFGALKYWFEKTVPYHGLDLRDLVWIVLVVVVLKIIAAIVIAQVAWKKQNQDEFQEKLLQFARPKKQQTGRPLVLALKDLISPFFLLSLALTGLFLFYSHHPWNEIIGHLMRPLAIGFMFFYFSRTLTLDRWLKRLHGGKLDTFAKGCEVALKKVRQIL